MRQDIVRSTSVTMCRSFVATHRSLALWKRLCNHVGNQQHRAGVFWQCVGVLQRRTAHGVICTGEPYSCQEFGSDYVRTLALCILQKREKCMLLNKRCKTTQKLGFKGTPIFFVCVSLLLECTNCAKIRIVSTKTISLYTAVLPGCSPYQRQVILRQIVMEKNVEMRR